MFRFLVGKAPSLLLVAFASSILAFLLPRLAPGDTAVAMAGTDASTAEVEAIRQQVGLDRPLVVQYVDWVSGLVRGDLGMSYTLHRPVAELIGDRLESTIELTVVAVLIMIALGFTLGILAGSLRLRMARSIIDVLNTLMLAMPPVLPGLLLILALGIVLPVFPISGEVAFLGDPVEGIQYLVLPATALALLPAAVVARLMQTSMNAVRQEEFVDLAVAKGVPNRRITIRHVLRNSLGVAVVAVGMRIGELLSGAIVIEAIFGRNGLGQLAVSSVQSRDYLVVQVLIVGAILVAVVVQLLTEISLAALDPRIRLGDQP